MLHMQHKMELGFYGEWTVRRGGTAPFPEVRLESLQLAEWLAIYSMG
jgi:hypothetical protein